jgi:cardiolipin synthase
MPGNFLTWFLGGAYALAFLATPHLLMLRKRPAATLAWLWALLLFPYVGVLLYWMIGTERIKRRRLKRRAAYLALGGGGGEKIASNTAENGRLSDREKDWMHLLSRLQETPVSSAASARLLVDAKQFYPRLKEAIQAAASTVHLQFYIWRDDEIGREFLDLLVQAARRGVKVRILLDELGCLGLSRRHFNPLLEAGGEFSWFLTLHPWRNRFFFNLRNHRKLQVIDSRLAFVGGMNLGREYAGQDAAFGEWRDLQMEVTGPVVQQLEEQLADDWYFATEKRLFKDKSVPSPEPCGPIPTQIIQGGPDFIHDRMECSMVSLFQYAQRRVWLCAGYFVPNSVLLAAIKMAAWRGVDVRLLVSTKNDHPYLILAGRSFYPELLRAGVRIYEYSIEFNHAKASLLDDHWLFIGSSNLDNRSMRLNFELNLLIKEPDQAAMMEKLFEGYFADSVEITQKKYEKQPYGAQLLEAVCRLFAPVL